MFRHSIVAACMLSLSLGSAALAQTSVTRSTVTRTFARTGVIQSISGDEVTVQDPDRIHEITVPDGFEVRMNGRDVGIDQLKPGMKVTEHVTDEVTTRDVTVTKRVDGTVMQVTPGGFVLLDPKDRYVSYDFTDPQGNDLHYLAPNGREDTLRNVEAGEHLRGTLVTRFPAQVIDERIVQLEAASAPKAAVSMAIPPPSAAANPGTELPKTGTLASH